MRVKIFSLLFISFIIINSCGKNEVVAAELQQKVLQLTELSPHIITVILERIYLDGDISEEIKEETIGSMDSLLAQYEDWQIVQMDDEQIVLQKNIDDISPLLKTNGYFGLSQKGILTIFDGKPAESRIIHSFFQIDTKKLESNKHKELIKGIPIMTKDRYVKVLETFKPFSLKPEKK